MRGSDKLSRRAIARRPSWLCGQRHDREPQWLRGRGGTATGVRHCERETTKDMVVRYSPGAKRITVGLTKASMRLISWFRTRPIVSLLATPRPVTADTRSVSRNASGSN
jgi:hypothetical protein